MPAGFSLDSTLLDGSWVKVTENHHENRMHEIHFGSKSLLCRLLAFFSNSRTRPLDDIRRN
jgi:hypothetical protein